MHRLASAILLLLSAATALANPGSAVAAAYQDARLLPPEVAKRTRYLSLYAIPLPRRAEFTKTLSFHVNSLSREAELIHPRQVTPDLLAVHFDDYQWSRATWEDLLNGANGVGEPYFHVPVKVVLEAGAVEVWPGGYEDGRYYPPGRYRVLKRKEVIQQAQAPWVDAKQVTALVKATNSQVPVVRADWFFSQTAIQADRLRHGYYDWLGLGKKEQDFERLIGANVAESKRVKKEIAGIMGRSGVTLQNRGILRFQSITGPYWVTQDYKTSTLRQNALRYLDGDTEPPAGDASERYGTLPNGLFCFWLQDGKGVRQDSAPDFIASDRSGTDNDGRVHAALSCVRCHAEGIRPVEDYARRIFTGAITLQTPDYKRFVRLRQLYLSDLAANVRRDQQGYGLTLQAFLGTGASTVARLYGLTWDRYQNDPVTPAAAALELGCTEAQLLAALREALKRTRQLDPLLAGLTQTPPVPLRREYMEEGYSLLQAVIHGYSPFEKVP